MAAILQPVVTEKSMQAVPENRYTFKVSPDTNKIEIAKEIKRLYKVDVESVRIINTKGKVKYFRRNPGKQSDIKKAIVTIKAGQKISGFDMGQEASK